MSTDYANSCGLSDYESSLSVCRALHCRQRNRNARYGGREPSAELSAVRCWSSVRWTTTRCVRESTHSAGEQFTSIGQMTCGRTTRSWTCCVFQRGVRDSRTSSSRRLPRGSQPVTTKATGAIDSVVDGVTGLLVDVDDANGLIAAWDRCGLPRGEAGHGGCSPPARIRIISAGGHLAGYRLDHAGRADPRRATNLGRGERCNC